MNRPPLASVAFLKIPGYPLPPGPPTLVKEAPKPCGGRRTGVLRNALRGLWHRVPISGLSFFPEISGIAGGQVLQSPNSASPSPSLCVWRRQSSRRGVGALLTTRPCKAYSAAAESPGPAAGSLLTHLLGGKPLQAELRPPQRQLLHL